MAASQSHAEWDDAGRIKAWAESNDVPLIDCTPLFTWQPVEDLKFSIDPHWNAKGHKLVGTSLAANTLSSYRLRTLQN